MDVVVDTNAIVSDYLLRSKRWRLLLSRAENDLITLHVPEAVVLEAVKHFQEDLEEASRALAGAKRQSDRLLATDRVDAAVDVDAEVAAYELLLRKTLGDVGASFEYPPVETSEFAEKVVKRKKPLKLDGSGYVDVIVWLRVRELAQDGDVALISDNYRDFGGNKQGGLHSGLEAELDEVGAGGRVTRYPSPSDFHVAALDHAELYDAQIREELGNQGVVDAIEARLLTLLEDREARAAGAWGSIASADDVFLEVGHVTGFELIEVTDAEAEGGYVNFEAWAEATYQFPVLYGEAWEPYEAGQLHDLDVEDPEGIVGTASRTVRLRLWVDAQYDPGTRRLSDFELTSASVED